MPPCNPTMQVFNTSQVVARLRMDAGVGADRLLPSKFLRQLAQRPLVGYAVHGSANGACCKQRRQDDDDDDDDISIDECKCRDVNRALADCFHGYQTLAQLSLPPFFRNR
jgi:hypothetical protein